MSREMTISGRMSVGRFEEDFKKSFGVHIEVKVSKRRAHNSTTIASLRKADYHTMPKSLTLSGSMLIRNVRKKIFTNYGITIDLYDGGRIASDNITLSDLRLRKKNTIKPIQSSKTVKSTLNKHKVKHTNVSPIETLMKLLEEEENRRDDRVTIGGIMSGFLKNSIGGGALSRALGGGSKTNIKKKEIISSFPLPDSKDDIIDFLVVALPKAKQKGNVFTKNNSEYIDHNEYVLEWKTKCEQIITKIKMINDKSFEDILQQAKSFGIDYI